MSALRGTSGHYSDPDQAWAEASGQPPNGRFAQAMVATACWAQALQGRGHPAAALVLLREVCGAEVGSLVRVTAGRGSGERLLTEDAGQARAARVQPGDLATTLIGRQRSRARVGSVWSYCELASSLLVAPQTRLARWMELRGIQDVLCIVLAVDGDVTDVLELCYTRRPGPSDIYLVDALAPALVSAWAHRGAQVLASLRRAAIQPVRSQPQAEPLLGPSNPAGLTRAEFRICGLFASGSGTREIMDQLQISESTLRSHLRSIYAKTETSGKAGLLHRLLRSDAAPDARIDQG